MNYILASLAGLLSAAVVTWAVLGLVYFDGAALIVDTLDLAKVVVFFKAGSRFRLRTNAALIDLLATRGQLTLVQSLTNPFRLGTGLLLPMVPAVYGLLAAGEFHVRELALSGLVAAGFWAVPLFLWAWAGKAPMRQTRMTLG